MAYQFEALRTSPTRRKQIAVETLLNLITKTLLFIACPAAIAYGGWVLSDYSYRPCDQGIVLNDLNSVDGILKLTVLEQASDECPILVLVYHPHCPCTASTVSNLERLNSAFSIQPHIVAFAYCPKGSPDSWIDSSTTSWLDRMGATVFVDREGDNCRQLGAATSGHVLLYDERRLLVFSGGITPGRGHEGTCSASTDLLRRVNGPSGDQTHWPVYGCPIVHSEKPQQ